MNCVLGGPLPQLSASRNAIGVSCSRTQRTWCSRVRCMPAGNYDNGNGAPSGQDEGGAPAAYQMQDASLGPEGEFANGSADVLVNRASKALKAARRILDNARTRQAESPNMEGAFPVLPPSTLTFGKPLSEQTTPPPGPFLGGESESGGSKPAPSLSKPPSNGKPAVDASSSGIGSRWNPDAADGSSRMPEMQLERQPVLSTVREYMEAKPGAEIMLPSQLQMDKAAAKLATLPPLQSIVELTTAHIAPKRQGTDGETSETAFREASAAGHLLQDGRGTLPDGSTYERLSGEDKGANGFWCRWWVLRGTSEAGAVEWEERWWEASDWSGLREMGAEKSGWNAQGDAWREYWKEKVYYRGELGEPCVERDAHKWAHNEGGEEWEEKWGEFYSGGGHITKWADKWGKAGNEVWHEKWGEEYWGGSACHKWTDRWAEKMWPDGQQEQHGDKWNESFRDGKGNKTGENWYVGGDGHRYHRSWGENHWGEGWVQKYGHDTRGDHWDTTEQTGTYYNPIPHFTFQMALDHSPFLVNVPVRPKDATEDNLLDGGLNNF